MVSPEATAKPFDDSVQLRREFDLLELRLQREILCTRAERGASGRFDQFAGLFISDEEIDHYLGKTGGEVETQTNGSPLDEKIAAAAQALDRDRRKAVEAGQLLRLEHLREAFALTPSEYHVLIACLAPDLDLRFERYFAYLQNDVSKKRPCVQFLGKLFPGITDGYPPVRRLVAAADSLVGLRLLDLVKSSEGGFASRELKVPEGVLHFLLAVDAPDPELGGIGKWRPGRALVGHASYYQHHQTCLEHLLSVAERDGSLPYGYIRGPEGCGKEDVVLAVAHRLSATVLECNGKELLAYAGEWDEWLRVLERDLRMRTAFLWIRHGDALIAAGDAHGARFHSLGRFLREHPAVNMLMTGEDVSCALRDLLGVSLLTLKIPPPNSREQLELWEEVTEEEGVALRSPLIEGLAAKFRFGPGKIRTALRLLQWEEPCKRPATDSDCEISVEERIHRACRSESSSALEAYAKKINPRYQWEDLVLPAHVLEHLREIRNCVRYRSKVHGEWGFGDKFSLGKGLHALFSGPTGTGKTMSAEVLASDLGLDVYKIDLSSVVSKYIGETEKQLARIFREAESTNCILLFDEADALFGKRSEVKDSHDRYANIEINYLLQRMDDYEGAVILTTNMANNLDPAFTRRIQYTVEFPIPDERHRELLWSKVFPTATPLGQDLDLGYLAKRFKLSGANIKNIAFNSAFLAASDGGVVDMAHVVMALRREYRKLGKLVSPSEFGPYYHLVGEESDESEGRWQ